MAAQCAPQHLLLVQDVPRRDTSRHGEALPQVVVRPSHHVQVFPGPPTVAFTALLADSRVNPYEKNNVIPNCEEPLR